MKKNQILSSVLKVLPVVCSIFFITPVIAQTDNTSSNCLSYNRTYEGDRYSPFGKDISSLQTGPVVVDGVMYFTTDTITYANNAVRQKSEVLIYGL